MFCDYIPKQSTLFPLKGMRLVLRGLTARGGNSRHEAQQQPIGWKCCFQTGEQCYYTSGYCTALHLCTGVIVQKL